MNFKNKSILAISLLSLFFLRCPENEDDLVMFHLYQTLHKEIEQAVRGTDIDPAYLAALISLESNPPGNKKSARFEPHVYTKLIALQRNGDSYGSLNRRSVLGKSDGEIRALATSYGLTQIMGFHCLDLGCSPTDLKGSYHLQWAVAWMQNSYGKQAARKDWNACFRMHNTGHPRGSTSRKDYVEKGLIRMNYYNKWMKNKGQLF